MNLYWNRKSFRFGTVFQAQVCARFEVALRMRELVSHVFIYLIECSSQGSIDHSCQTHFHVSLVMLIWARGLRTSVGHFFISLVMLIWARGLRTSVGHFLISLVMLIGARGPCGRSVWPFSPTLYAHRSQGSSRPLSETVQSHFFVHSRVFLTIR